MLYYEQLFVIHLVGRFVKNIKNHNSLHACERCIAVNQSVHNHKVFNTSQCFSADKRLPRKFANLDYLDSHQLGPSALVRITANSINACALDYMPRCCAAHDSVLEEGGSHCETKQCLDLAISEKLVFARDFIPSEFAMRPQSLLELDRRKATEFRQFLLYTGPVVLKSVLQPELHIFFVCLLVLEYCSQIIAKNENSSLIMRAS